MTLAPGSTLGPYAILAQLGAGGMGVVYTAQDPRLKRQVAIKFLTPDLTRNETAKQRFLQEAQAASALDHPNNCTIHEINETPDGQLYLVMAYYEGETLKQRIERGPLALDEAVDIATQVGQGLAEAHGAVIVHRDIKPANLLIAKGGVVKILDFGLAKLAGTEGVTQTGTTVGTLAYMSPEQARGEEVDHRTDIWSLGVVLYEMLTGQQPFQGGNLLAISGAIQQDAPPALTGDSSSLNGVVSRALHKNQSKRYQAVTDLLDGLRKATSPATQATSQSDVPSIAVLPFADMSPEKDQDYFCEGMAEEIINALTALDGLHVASRTSAFLAKARNFDIAKIGTRLNVAAVLEGSVRKAGNRLRVTVQLINVSDGYHLWSERYDRNMEDVFAVQDEIARTVVEKLKVKLLGEHDAPMVRRPTDNLDAYNLCLEGRYFLARSAGTTLEKGLDCYRQALALTPTYAQAHAGVAQVQATRAMLSLVSPHAVVPPAKQAATEALAIDDTVADAHTALAMVLHLFEWDWLGAEREYCRALELNSGDTFAQYHYAYLLGSLRRFDMAVSEARSTVERDPLSLAPRTVLALALLWSRRFDESIAEAHAAIDLDPSYHPAHLDLGRVLGAVGRYEEAVEVFSQAACPSILSARCAPIAGGCRILPVDDVPMASDPTSSIAGKTTHRPRRRPPDVVPRHRTLDGVVKAVSQTDGIGLIDVDAFTTLVVRTDNSVYRITILTPHLREVLVQGGKFFPERTRACLSGSNFGGSCLKIGWVGLGLHMEFHAGDQWIITSHVRAIAVEPSATGAPC